MGNVLAKNEGWLEPQILVLGGSRKYAGTTGVGKSELIATLAKEEPDLDDKTSFGSYNRTIENVAVPRKGASGRQTFVTCHATIVGAMNYDATPGKEDTSNHVMASIISTVPKCRGMLVFYDVTQKETYGIAVELVKKCESTWFGKEEWSNLRVIMVGTKGDFEHKREVEQKGVEDSVEGITSKFIPHFEAGKGDLHTLLTYLCTGIMMTCQAIPDSTLPTALNLWRNH